MIQEAEDRIPEAFDVGEIELPGLEKFIEQNNGSESDALKALWFQYKQEMDWKAYAIGAHKSIMKLVVQFQKLIPAVRDACGSLAHAGFKDKNGLSLEFAKSFQSLVKIGSLIKENDLTNKTTMRHVKKITELADGGRRVAYDECGHTEDVPEDKVEGMKINVGDKITCPSCYAMMDTMKRMA